MVLALLTFGGLQTQIAAAPQIGFELPPNTIHPRIVNLLIKVAADGWNLTVGYARQAYNDGDLQFMEYPAGGPNTYMITYEGGCILAALDDEL